MKIGIQLYPSGPMAAPEFIGTVAKSAEERGFQSIWLAEHILLFPELASPYPYSADGSFPFDTSQLPLEPFTALSFIAGQTSTIRLATGVSVLPQRNPVFAAKQAADVDLLSGGRLDYGIGVGWCLEEIAALGTPTGRRGARTDDYVRLMKALWTEEVPEYQGEFYTLPPSYSGPKPVQQPHPPLYFGGRTKAALRRVARLGDGWFAPALPPGELATAVGDLAAACLAEERQPTELSIAAGSTGGRVDPDEARAYREAGADQIIVPLGGRTLDSCLARLDDLAENLVIPTADL